MLGLIGYGFFSGLCGCFVECWAGDGDALGIVGICWGYAGDMQWFYSLGYSLGWFIIFLGHVDN